jgi:hypothetical protein
VEDERVELYQKVRRAVLIDGMTVALLPGILGSTARP